MVDFTFTFTWLAPVSEMTYTVSSGTLNHSIPYHTWLALKTSYVRRGRQVVCHGVWRVWCCCIGLHVDWRLLIGGPSYCILMVNVDLGLLL